MKIRSLVLASLIALAGPIAAVPAFAQAPKAASAEMAEGVVTKIDKAGGKATIKHGELKSVGMGPMTMTFKVKDAVGLGKVAVGDKVKFVVKEEGGDYVVTKLDKAP
jgi:Cu/Ag efflux protein CusF